MKQLFVFISMFVWPYSGMAMPVEYLRVCSLYGAGFHYVPGTDTCLQATTGITKVETENGTLQGQSELAQRVAELEAKLELITKRLGVEK